MGLFSRKKSDVLDLTENYHLQQAREARSENAQQIVSESSSNVGGLGFLSGLAGAVQTQNSSAQNEEYVDVSSGAGERRRKLAKRLMDMTQKLEDISNQIYHLQQRLEVVERKVGVSGFN